MEPKRYDVVIKGPTVVSSHDQAQEAADLAKQKALMEDTMVEVVDNELGRPIFRARSGEWRWITR